MHDLQECLTLCPYQGDEDSLARINRLENCPGLRVRLDCSRDLEDGPSEPLFVCGSFPNGDVDPKVMKYASYVTMGYDKWRESDRPLAELYDLAVDGELPSQTGQE